VEFLLDSCGISKVFPWCFYGIIIGILMGFFVAPMLFHVISMICLWDFCGIPLGFPWYFYDLSMGVLWDVNWK
jgi:hypothetical protein